MYLILAAPFFILSFLAWSRVREFLAPGRHVDFRPLFPHDPLFSAALWLDAQKVTEVQFIVYTLVAGLFLAALGFLVDLMLRGRGFGAAGNASLLLTGFAGAAWAWWLVAPIAFQGRLEALVLVSALGGGGVLLLAAWLRRLVLERLEDFASGATPSGPASASTAPSPRVRRGRNVRDVVGRQSGKNNRARLTGPRR